LPILSPSLITRVFGSRHPYQNLQVPHCDLHGHQRYAMFAILFHRMRSTRASLTCYGLDATFLDDLRKPYVVGDLIPPWLFAPQPHAEAGWNQGEEESWMQYEWRPFWRELSQTTKWDTWFAGTPRRIGEMKC
jgi:hypothetical protein